MKLSRSYFIAGLFACLLLSASIINAESLLPRIKAPGGFWLVDDSGRVVILRGVNLVSRIKKTPEELGFDARNAALLREHGFNVVRLGINWSAVESKPGEYNDAYLDSIKRTLHLLAQNGIYSLVDFHSGNYGEVFDGDGAPAWATARGGTSTPDRGFPLNYFGGPIYDIRSDIDVAWDAFWENRSMEGRGLQDHYAAMIRYVAGYLKSEGGNIVGYDLMNEPVIGSGWPAALNNVYPPSEPDFYKGSREFDERYLTPFYRKIIPAIRDADPDAIAWYEPNYLHGLGAACFLDKLNYGNIGMAFHNYDQRSAYTKPITDSLDYHKRTDHPLFVTEYGATLDNQLIRKSQDENDRAMLSAIYWAYFNNPQYKFPSGGAKQIPADPRRQAVVIDMAKPLTAPNVNTDMLNELTRVYPRLISGTPSTIYYNPESNTFHLDYRPGLPGGTTSELPTEIVVPKAKLPNGYEVTVKGGKVISAANAPVAKIAADNPHRVIVDIKAR